MKEETSPIIKSEILEILKKEDSMCRVNFETIRKKDIIKGKGTGFFLELDNKSIPFNKCLITKNNILNEEDIKIGKEISIEYENKKKILKITKNRRAFTNKKLDYTLIEILSEDKIKNFFRPYTYSNSYEGKDVFLLQYVYGSELGFSYGKVLSIKQDNIIHNCSTQAGSSGAPLLLRGQELSIIGVHYGRFQNEIGKASFKLATSIKSIIDNIINEIAIFFNPNDYKKTFKILEKIGNGNFGTVYKGEIDKANFRALKIIDKEEMRNRLRINYNKDNIEEEFKEYIEDKLKNEIKIMRLCMKDNINSVEFYECYNTKKEYLIVMELCDDNLQNILNKKNTGFKNDEVIDIIKQLNNTFKIMSVNKIIHRNLKLENILVKYTDKNKSKYIVKLAGRTIFSLSQKCSTYSGTIFTMAPEILAGEEYDSKCDLWSLGIIIYQLLFKKYPYEASTEVAIYNQIKKLGQSIIKKTGNEKIDNLLKKLLVENPQKRLNWEEYFKEPIFGDK